MLPCSGSCGGDFKVVEVLLWLLASVDSVLELSSGFCGAISDATELLLPLLLLESDGNVVVEMPAGSSCSAIVGAMTAQAGSHSGYIASSIQSMTLANLAVIRRAPLLQFGTPDCAEAFSVPGANEVRRSMEYMVETRRDVWCRRWTDSVKNDSVKDSSSADELKRLLLWVGAASSCFDGHLFFAWFLGWTHLMLKNRVFRPPPQSVCLTLRLTIVETRAPESSID